MAFCLYQIKHCYLVPRLKNRPCTERLPFISFFFLSRSRAILQSSHAFYSPGSWGTPKPCLMINSQQSPTLSMALGLYPRCSWLQLIFQKTALELAFLTCFLKTLLHFIASWLHINILRDIQRYRWERRWTAGAPPCLSEHFLTLCLCIKQTSYISQICPLPYCSGY